ncbi:MAG: hypothetical protein JWN76_2534 [Chitinophagaceae bacterium]|nr:hypothetical protein [Chitinophagaceae bacterium]
MKVFLVSLAVCVSAVTISFGQSVKKNIQLSKGQQFEQKSETTLTMSQEMMGQKIDVKTKTTNTNLIEIKDVSDNGYSVASTLKRVQMNMSNMGQEMTFDSDKPADMNGELAEGFKDQIGKTSVVVVDKNGIVKEVQNPDTKDAEEMNAIAEQVGKSLSFLSNFPAAGVNSGASWTDSASLAGGKTVSTYTLQSVHGNNAVVNIISSGDMNREMERQGMTMKMKLKNNVTGNYTVDLLTGIISSSSINTKSNGTMEMMGQSIPLSMETIVITTLVKK